MCSTLAYQHVMLTVSPHALCISTTFSLLKKCIVLHAVYMLLVCLLLSAVLDNMAERPQKLNAFRRRLPHASASALGAIVADIAQHGLPADMDNTESFRRAFREARDLQNAKITPYGPILTTTPVIKKSDDIWNLAIAHPMALLWLACSDCNGFSGFLYAKLLEIPSTLENPWSLVFYTDEVTPGDPLATLNKGKFHAMYWSFLELGINALSREEAWFTCICAYSTHVAELHDRLLLQS